LLVAHRSRLASIPSCALTATSSSIRKGSPNHG
jgi:hypothetical protein